MDTIDIFFDRMEKEISMAKTKSRLSLLKRKSKQFAKDVSKNPLANKALIQKAILRNKKIEVIVAKKSKEIR